MENITGKDKETREIENIVNYKTPDEQIDEFRHIFSDKKSDPDNTKLNIIPSVQLLIFPMLSYTL